MNTTTLNQTLSFNTETLDRKLSDKANRKERYQMNDHVHVNGDVKSDGITRGNDVKYDPVPVIEEQQFTGTCNVSAIEHQDCKAY